MSYNPFNNDVFSCITLCNAVKACPKLFHFGLCDCSRDCAIRLARSGLRSLSLEDTQYALSSFKTVCRCLTEKKVDLCVLSLKFMTIDLEYAINLEKSLRVNKTLICLNLYGTGLSDNSGARIISALCKNKNMIEIDLGANKLRTEFCINLGKFLKENNVMTKVDISKNYFITNENFAFVLDGLVHNQVILSLGELFDTKIGVKMRETAEKILIINKGLYEVRTKIENEKGEMVQNPEILLKKSQKFDYFNSSVDFENWDKKKRENLDKLKDESEKKMKESEIEDEINEVLTRYDIYRSKPNKFEYEFQVFNNIY